MPATLNTELENAYSELMKRMGEWKQDTEIGKTLSLLESIDDGTKDIDILFSKDPNLLKEPRRWVDALRLLRYSILLKTHLGRLYDGFVRAYELLSHKPDPDADEKKLKEEISNLMYSVDENSGEHERLAEKIFSEAALQFSLHSTKSQNSSLLYLGIDNKIQPRIHEMVAYLIEISQKFKMQYEIALALERMEKLILEASQKIV